MKIAWITLTNGRKDLIFESRSSWYKNLEGVISLEVIVDDSGDKDYRDWLSSEYPSANIVPVGEDNCGFSNAMSKCFDMAAESDCDYILHTEDDFILNKKIKLDDLVTVLDSDDKLAQVALQRQGWFDHEKTHNTLIQSIKSQGYNVVQKENKGLFYVEHNHYWTCNPSLYPVFIAKMGWPKENDSEKKFTQKVFGLGLKSSYFGKEDEEYLVTHTGSYRLGGGH